MKNFKVSALILMSAFLFSCSSDDDNSNPTSIVGKWANIDTVVDGTSIPYDDHEACGKDYVEFQSDNTYVNIDVLDCEEITDLSGNYSINGNFITIDGETAEITQLTESRLSMKIWDEDFDDDDELDEVILNFERL